MKTFHHLKTGDKVALVYWGDDPADALETVEAEVLAVYARRVDLQFKMRHYEGDANTAWDARPPYETVQPFSRRTGYRWGGDATYDYFIDKKHAEKRA